MRTTILLTLQALFPRRVTRVLAAALGPEAAGPGELAGLLKGAEPLRAAAGGAAPGVGEVEAAWARARAVVEAADRAGLLVLATHDPAFPPALRLIPDPPLVLFVRGQAALLSAPRAVAVIGARRPSPYGLRAAGRAGAALAGMGFVVVSGLAAGCDAAAHGACLQAGGLTVAVLPGGADEAWPRENRPLYEAILAGGGCHVSEYPPGEEPHRWSFVQRDRLQSGLSLGVVLIETGLGGGAMHTVRFAHRQGKPVAVVASHPPRLRGMPGFQGNARLLEEGRVTALAARGDLERFASRLPGA